MRLTAWRHNIPARFAVVLSALLLMLPVALVTSAPSAAAGTPGCGTGSLNEAQLDGVFANPGVGATARQEGFGGGDYPHAYPLPDGRVLWMFQDMHFSNDNVLGATNAVHNGALVQEGNCWFVQGSMGRDFMGDLLTDDSRTWFWPLDGEIGYDGNLWIFMAEMRNPAA